MADDAIIETRRELVQALCLEAGRIMEDVSADLALALPTAFDQISLRVDQLHRAAIDILAIAHAARALVR